MSGKEIMLLNCGSTGCETSVAVIADEYEVFWACFGGCPATGTVDLRQVFRLFVRCEAVAKNRGIAPRILPITAKGAND